MERWFDVKGLMAYTTLGREKARKLGVDAGAVIRFGRRIVYDREKIDAYMESVAK